MSLAPTLRTRALASPRRSRPLVCEMRYIGIDCENLFGLSCSALCVGPGPTTAGGFCRRHPLWILLGAGLDYREGLRKAIPGDRHINILETKALMLVEKEVSHEGFNRRAFGLSDSQVALAVAVKGRSFSAARNEVLQDSLAVHIDCNSILSSGFLPTEFNSADGHSRNRKCGQRMLEWPAGLLESLAADLMLGWRLTGRIRTVLQLLGWCKTRPRLPQQKPQSSLRRQSQLLAYGGFGA